jgi:chaperonin GroES
MAKSLTPIGNRILVELIDIVQPKGAIIRVNAEDAEREARVIAVGTGMVDLNGKKIPMGIEVGDTVLIGAYSRKEIKLNDKSYYMVELENVIGLLN